jgi:hypothetical protein
MDVPSETRERVGRVTFMILFKQAKVSIKSTYQLVNNNEYS